MTVEGRPIRELKAIVAAELARLRRIEDIWHELTDEQQDTLVTEAEAMHSENESEDES